MKMKVFILAASILMFSMTAVLASINVRMVPLTNELLSSGTHIIDIRTEKEWRETGVIKGSLCLTFFKEDKTFDGDAFVAKLKQYVNPNDKIAIVCRSGNRSLQVSKFLVQRGFTAVTDVIGGIASARNTGIKLVPYRQIYIPFKAAK